MVSRGHAAVPRRHHDGTGARFGIAGARHFPRNCLSATRGLHGKPDRSNSNKERVELECLMTKTENHTMKKIFNSKSKSILLRVIALLCLGAWLIGVNGCAVARSGPQ